MEWRETRRFPLRVLVHLVLRSKTSSLKESERPLQMGGLDSGSPVELLHDESLAERGGASGLRDENLLASALARPLKLALYGQPDVAELAAAYGVGLARNHPNHPFVDGNKRVAFLAVGVFLALNGQRLVASHADATLTVLAVAAGQIDEATFARWLREHSAPRHS